MKSILKDRLRKAFESHLDSVVEYVLSKCLECEADTDHMHHLIPKVHDGETVVPVCNACHGKVHDINFTNHAELTKAGMEKAGIRLVDDVLIEAVAQMLGDGKTYTEIANDLKVSRQTISKVKRSHVSQD
jgi:hypothetical protein